MADLYIVVNLDLMWLCPPVSEAFIRTPGPAGRGQRTEGAAHLPGCMHAVSRAYVIWVLLALLLRFYKKREAPLPPSASIRCICIALSPLLLFFLFPFCQSKNPLPSLPKPNPLRASRSAAVRSTCPASRLALPALPSIDAGEVASVDANAVPKLAVLDAGVVASVDVLQLARQPDPFNAVPNRLAALPPTPTRPPQQEGDRSVRRPSRLARFPPLDAGEVGWPGLRRRGRPETRVGAGR